MRVEILRHLQRHLGNAHVQRLMESVPYQVQRYPVGAPRTADCQTVIQWLDAHSPYRPMWAKTNVTFRWTGAFRITGSAPDFQVGIVRPRVTVSKPVDMPRWSPRAPAMARAWTSMTSDLRAHEAQHEAIADRWRGILLQRLTALSLTVNAATRDAALAAAPAGVDAEWTAWLAEHQTDQDAIDPFTALLNCP
jgi:hypothetical protein